MKLHFLSAVFLLLQLAPAWAQPPESNSLESAEPIKGEILLSVKGLLDDRYKGGERHFDLNQLKAFESDSFVVKTRWSESKHEYHGPKLSAILAAVGAKGNSLRLFALNDYSVDVDLDFIEKYQPILAWREDGKAMTLRNKGPLWLMLPLHKYDELNEFKYTAAMIWQLRSIEIR